MDRSSRMALICVASLVLKMPKNPLRDITGWNKVSAATGTTSVSSSTVEGDDNGDDDELPVSVSASASVKSES